MNHTATAFFQKIAHHILKIHANLLPDLSEVVVLLPNHHVAQPLTDAITAAMPNLVLPQMLTLSEWAQTVKLQDAVVPDVCRATTLYQALRDRKWFADANLWAMSQELIGLLDELTRHHVKLPQDEADFLAQLEAAYQANSNTSLQFEAKVVHELWYAMSASGEISAARAYQERLATLAQRATSPLVVLVAADLDTQDTTFLETYAKRASVSTFDLREMMTHEADCALLSALPELWGSSSVSLVEQAEKIRAVAPQASLTNRLRLFGANGLDQEARAADAQVRSWLAEGKQNIAIVAQDRLSARRVRAMLERTGVPVNDESGWKLSTMAVSTVLMRWLDALQSDFYYQDMLDMLKSPFMAGKGADSKRAVFTLEQLVRKHCVTSHLDAFITLAQGEPQVLVVLERLQSAAKMLQKSTDTLHGWLESLLESLAALGITEALEADSAGVNLLENLKTWMGELEQDTSRFTRTEWKHWLSQLLDDNTFSEEGEGSQVHITHLAATRWRSFDAVLLLGCDANHLPSPDKDSVWFNDSVRGTLGLPTHEIHQARQRDTLLSLLAMNDNVLATWQSTKGGEQVMLSPYLEMLKALHKQTFGEDLDAVDLRAQVENARTSPKLPAPSTMPAPSVPASMVPKQISPSGYNSLVACPYQYFARHMLRLNKMDEVSEGVEKRDYGQWVHHILHKFHTKHPVLTGIARSDLIAFMEVISEEVFAPIIKHDFQARAWLTRWLQSIPSYLDTQLKNEEEGWRYQNGEVPFSMPLSAELTLQGRIDRVDENAAGEIRVMDYKLMDAYKLRIKVKEAGEDVQLPCYSSAANASATAFVSIEKNKVVNVVPPQELPELIQSNTARLLDLFGQMKSGAKLPANGVDDACAYCEMKGLCRKAEWHNQAHAQH